MVELFEAVVVGEVEPLVFVQVVDEHVDLLGAALLDAEGLHFAGLEPALEGALDEALGTDVA